MAIEGAMQIDGGNWQIFDGMLNASNASVHLDTKVDSISKHKGKYSVKTLAVDANENTPATEAIFDTVVLAAPLQFSDIKLEEGLLKHTPDKIPYVSLHVTLFTSSRTLDRGYFNLAPDAEVPTSILTTLQPDQIPTDPEKGCGKPGFFSISTLRTVINPKTLEKENLYKVFSPQALDSDFLSGILGIPSKSPPHPIFQQTKLTTPVPKNLSTISPTSGDAITWYYPHVWHSYPYEYPRVTFEDSALASNFYYTSGMESFISTMETMALMGMNVAQLVVDEFNEVLVDEVVMNPDGSQRVLFPGVSPGDEL
jgi:prenylcysteine oxidase/farnesylcysteine lyase